MHIGTYKPQRVLKVWKSAKSSFDKKVRPYREARWCHGYSSRLWIKQSGFELSPRTRTDSWARYIALSGSLCPYVLMRASEFNVGGNPVME